MAEDKSKRVEKALDLAFKQLNRAGQESEPSVSTMLELWGTIAEIMQDLYDDAHTDGYTEGHTIGWRKGYHQGKEHLIHTIEN